jgi:hypothetical protein
MSVNSVQPRNSQETNRKARPRVCRRTLQVVYRTGAGVVRETFHRANIGAALMRAEFVERVEGCPVFLKYPHSDRLVRAVS